MYLKCTIPLLFFPQVSWKNSEFYISHYIYVLNLCPEKKAFFPQCLLAVGRQWRGDPEDLHIKYSKNKN